MSTDDIYEEENLLVFEHPTYGTMCAENFQRSSEIYTTLVLRADPSAPIMLKLIKEFYGNR